MYKNIFSTLMTRLIKIIKNPRRIILVLMNKGFLNWISDETYIKIQYRAFTGKKLSLLLPETYNEKRQWLKLYGNLQNYIHLVDKFEVRNYISETIGEDYLIPLIGVWDRFDDIDFDKLPEQFVLKCTHDSGGLVICTDKTKFNLKYARKKINRALKQNFYYKYREKQYKTINPKIICEKYMVDESGKELKDYKIFCFNGIPKVIHVDYDRFTNHKRNFYDIDWNYLPVSIKVPTDCNIIIEKPSKLDKMLNIAKILSKGYPHVRVDLYLIHDKIYFGELTFSHGAGFEKFEPEEFGYQMGCWLELPKDRI